MEQQTETISLEGYFNFTRPRSDLEKYYNVKPLNLNADSENDMAANLENCHYTGIYKNHKHKRIFVSINTGALFFAEIWAVYRNMYAVTLVCLLLRLVAFSCFMLTKANSWLFLLLAINPILGFYGDAIYRAHVVGWIKNKKLAKQGTSCVAAAAFLFFMIQGCNMVYTVLTTVLGNAG